MLEMKKIYNLHQWSDIDLENIFSDIYLKCLEPLILEFKALEELLKEKMVLFCTN